MKHGVLIKLKNWWPVEIDKKNKKICYLFDMLVLQTCQIFKGSDSIVDCSLDVGLKCHCDCLELHN